LKRIHEKDSLGLIDSAHGRNCKTATTLTSLSTGLSNIQSLTLNIHEGINDLKEKQWFHAGWLHEKDSKVIYINCKNLFRNQAEINMFKPEYLPGMEDSPHTHQRMADLFLAHHQLEHVT
jgi:hypothetical protein